jgi:hypothetical protein
MASAMFGNPLAPLASQPLYAETQVEMWVLDGGIILLICYPLAVAAAMATAGAAALRHPDPEVSFWSGTIITYGLTVAVSTIGSVPFIAITGCQFWCLFAAAHGAAERSRIDAAKAAARLGAAP